MKKLLWLVFICLTLSGCKRDPMYYSRDIVAGNYDFSIRKVDYDNWTNTYGDTTFYYVGEIKKGTKKNTIVIHFMKDISIEAFMNEDGTLVNCICNAHYDLIGEFESPKTLKFTYNYIGYMGHTRYEVSGKKL